MLLLANQTIGVKIPPYLNNGEYLEALEVFKLPKRVTYYAAKLPDSYINSKVLIRIKCTPKGNLATRYSILAGLHIGEKQYYAANDTHGYWNPARTEYEKFL